MVLSLNEKEKTIRNSQQRKQQLTQRTVQVVVQGKEGREILREDKGELFQVLTTISTSQVLTIKLATVLQMPERQQD